MNVRLSQTMRFTAGVHYNDVMQINEYTLKVWMTTNSYNSANHNIAYERLKYFVYRELESTIFINQDNKEQCKLYINAGLNITTMPGEPVDQIIGVMLFHKLNAIMEDRIVLSETELSSTMGDNMGYLHSDNETTTDVEQPDWWNSADTVHCDSDLIGIDVLSLPGTIWRELDLDWPDEQEELETENIVFADFKNDNETK